MNALSRALADIATPIAKAEPKPDRVLTFEFEGLEIDIPCYVEIEPGDGPLVTLADKSLWRIVEPTADMDRAIRENFEEQLVEEDRQQRMFDDYYDEDDRRLRR